MTKKDYVNLARVFKDCNPANLPTGADGRAMWLTLRAHVMGVLRARAEFDAVRFLEATEKEAK